MTRKQLSEQIREKKSFLCVGLDTELEKLPPHLRIHYNEPVYPFVKAIVEATHESVVAYKFNIAFYESMGAKGWDILENCLSCIPKECFRIADAKRADIGNTSEQYARVFFERFDFDAITVSPYMGTDSLKPFYGYKDKWVIILALTSNPGSADFQMQRLANGNFLFQEVINKFSLGTEDNTMFVVGATKEEYIREIRQQIPDHFLLMPGIGAQGGDLDRAIQLGKNDKGGLLINSSRGIIYADSGRDFAMASFRTANELRRQMLPYFD